MQKRTALDLLADGVVTVKEASGIARRCVSSLYADMDAGRLAYVRYGRSRRIPRRALFEFMAAGLQGGWATPANGDGHANNSISTK